MKSLADNIAEICGKIKVDSKNTAGMDLKFAVVEDEDAQRGRTAAKLKALFDILLQKTDSIFS